MLLPAGGEAIKGFTMEIPADKVAQWMILANKMGLNGQKLDSTIPLPPESATQDWSVVLIPKADRSATDC